MHPTTMLRAAHGLRFPFLLVLIWLLPAAGGRDLIPRGMDVVPHTVVVETAPEFADHGLAMTFGRYRNDVLPVTRGEAFPVYGKYLSSLVLLPPGTALPAIPKPRQADLPAGAITLAMPFPMTNTVAQGTGVKGYQTWIRVVARDGAPAVEVIRQRTLRDDGGPAAGPEARLVLVTVIAAAMLLLVVTRFRRGPV